MSNISSMTGYANAKVQTDMGLLSIDIRSVNSRFLDLSFRASEEIRFLEPKFREIISGKIARGKMECRLNLVDSGLSADTALNEEALNKLMALQTQVLKTDTSATALRVADILNYPGIVAAPVPDPEVFAKQVLTGFEQCLEVFNESRQREGAALAQVLLKYCTQIEDLVNTLRPKIPEILQAQKDKLTERLEEALGTTLADGAQITKEEVNERIRQEITLYGIKLDVNEEMERLCTHVKEVRRTLDRGGPVGRKLDFLMQELNREANTLGSKAVSISMTDTSVNLKLVIESMREQIQNLE
ncbi:YicC/YloC family endoribonuclease [Parasutterella sp.]|uniref:YicC/YloC family endoribonuclease n=1 Tax=Parasutterella sp. TaxID=2049037 RepID=UPI00351FCA6B